MPCTCECCALNKCELPNCVPAWRSMCSSAGRPRRASHSGPCPCGAAAAGQYGMTSPRPAMQPGLHLASYSSGVTWACTDAGLLVTVCVPVHGSPSWPRLCPILHGALRAGQQRHADVLQVVRPWYTQTEVARRTARKAGKRASKQAETATATTISLAGMPAGHDSTHGLLLPGCQRHSLACHELPLPSPQLLELPACPGYRHAYTAPGSLDSLYSSGHISCAASPSLQSTASWDRLPARGHLPSI